MCGLGLEELGSYLTGGEFFELLGEEFGVTVEKDGSESGEVVFVGFGVGESPGESLVGVLCGPFLEVLAEGEVVFFRAMFVGKIKGFGGVSFE
ncbi:MAG: hypothetical protein ACI9NQ_000055 [Paracoccaceae bacterium]|jgi:hypothetical protein